MVNTSPGMPVAWMTQVSVTDADETAAKITKAGGPVRGPERPAGRLLLDH